MFRSAAIAFWRSLTRHPLYAALNILGLSFGVAVFIVISLYVRFETGYERWLPGADDIYEVRTTFTYEAQRRSFNGAAGVVLEEISQAQPNLTGTHIVDDYIWLHRDSGVLEVDGQLVDRDFFKIFDLPLEAGDSASALRPEGIILSDAMARRLFGRVDIVGQVLRVRETGNYQVTSKLFSPGLITLTVTGVLKPPPGNTSLGSFDYIRLSTERDKLARPVWNNPGALSGRTFFRLSDSHEADRINREMDSIIDAVELPANVRGLGGKLHEHIRLDLLPLVNEHLADEKIRARTIGLAGVSMVALVISMINYVNLGLARAGRRAHDLALRRVSGATRDALSAQLLCEASMFAGIAGILGFSLVELLLPLVNDLGGLKLRLDYSHGASFLLVLLAAVVCCGLIAGLYPALLLPRMATARDRLRTGETQQSGGNNGVRMGLITTQFAAVGAAFVILAGFSAQVRHMQTSDLGIVRDGIVTTWSTNTEALSPNALGALSSAWRRLPGVRAVAQGLPPGRYYNILAYRSCELEGASVRAMFASQQFDANLNVVLGGRLLAGRLIDDRDFAAGDLLPLGSTPGIVAVDVNQTGVKALGLTSADAAVGRFIQHEKIRFQIVGVVADQRLAAPTQPVLPMLYVNNALVHPQNATLIRFEQVSPDVVMERMIQVWRRMEPDLPLELEAMSNSLEAYYVEDRQMTNLFAIGAGVAALIGAIGLYGMAAFSTSARATEIALRKVMGATRWQVMRLLVFQFIKPVLIANVIAWPIGGVILWKWLAQFDDRVTFSPWFFIAASAASILIAVLTVGGLAFATASQSPGKVLRHE